MKPITMYKTYDGEVFSTRRLAQKHLNDQYYKILHKLADGVVLLKVWKIMEYINENLDQFETLRMIKKDMELIEEEEE